MQKRVGHLGKIVRDALLRPACEEGEGLLAIAGLCACVVHFHLYLGEISLASIAARHSTRPTPGISIVMSPLRSCRMA